MIPPKHREFVSCSDFSEQVSNLRWGQDFELGNVFPGVKKPKQLSCKCTRNINVIQRDL